VPTKSKPLAGLQRKQMVEMIRKPMAAWIKTGMQGSFPAPQSAEACDIMAEAVGLAVMDTIGASPMGKAALERLALDILDRTKGKHHHE